MAYQRPDIRAGAVRLHFNENTAGCSPAVLSAIHAITREDVAFYPDYEPVTARAARYLGVPADWVQLTNGLDEGLHVVALTAMGSDPDWRKPVSGPPASPAHAMGSDPAHANQGSGSLAPQAPSKGSGLADADQGSGPLVQQALAKGSDPAHANQGPTPQVLIAEPAFEMYAACAEAVGAEVVRVLPEFDGDFAFPLTRLLDAITTATRVIYLTDPNNPTGLPIPAGAVESIASATPHALVLVDEAYADFSGRTLIGEALDRHRNLIVGRTFAKAHGLAALRIGALIAHPDTLAPIRRLMPPYSLNICAVRALEAALDDRAYVGWYLDQAQRSKAAIYAFAEHHGLTFWPSDANFVLVRVGHKAAAITTRMADAGFLIRDKSRAPGCAGCLRITAGVLDHTNAALAALEPLLAPRED